MHTDLTTDTTQKSRTRVFKILNSINTICGENCVSFLMGFSKFINQEIYMQYFVSVDHN